MSAPLRQNARGTELILGDGNKWLIPFMPVGPKGAHITQMMDDISNIGDTGAEGEGKNSKVWEHNFNLLVEIMKVNYPNLTSQECEDLFDIVLFNKILGIFSGNPAAANNV